MKGLPMLKTADGKTELIVNGKPFVILGFQWSCDLSSDEDFVDSYLPDAKRIGCNTAVIPLYWKDVEPRPGDYRLENLVKRIKACRENDLKMVVLWFGAHKNAQLWYAPEWVYEDTDTYPRVIRKNGEMFKNTACPLYETTLERDRTAFIEVMNTIKSVDADENTVIAVQIENEAGVLSSDRCYCQRCNHTYAEEGWKDPESYMATYFARYIEKLAKAGKEIYPLPFYVNAWLDGQGFDRPGLDYPSGGPNMKNLEIYKMEAPHIDFVAPDTYDTDYRSFHEVCRAYASNGNPLFIAEHSAYGNNHRAEKNIFYAIGEYGAIGFDPYCINNNDSPIVSLDHEINQSIHSFMDSLKVINDAMPAIVEARQTEKLKAFAAEEAEKYCLIKMGRYAFRMEYKGKGARGMLIQLSEDEFLVPGIDIEVKICDMHTREVIVPAVCEWGRYVEGLWVKTYSANRETMLGFVPFSGPSVARMKMSNTHDWNEDKKIRNTQ